MNFWFSLFLFARSARTCRRRCHCPSMMNILCVAFRVPHRVIRTVRCFQFHESFVLIFDWRDWMIVFVAGLVEKHVDLGGSRSSESILERWHSAIAHSRMCSPGIFAVHVFLNSFTNLFLVGVERLDLMMYFKDVWHFNVVFVKLPCSIMSFVRHWHFVFFRRTCLNTDHVLRDISLPWSNWKTAFFVVRFHTDLS